MALINKINGQLLKQLTQRAGGYASTSGSSISGSGSGATFDRDAVKLQPGLQLGSQYFANSYKRLVTAATKFEKSSIKLSQIFETVLSLKALASEAASPQVTDNERSKLNKEFKENLREYQRMLGDDATEENDLLSISDLREILKDAGINLNSSSVVSDKINSIGGEDNSLGEETITLSNQTTVDLSSLSIGNQAGAQSTYEALTKLSEEVQKDYKGIGVLYSELIGAQSFALYGGGAFSKAADGSLIASDADQLAQEITGYIRRNGRDTSIAAHSNLDARLAQNLLGSS